MSVDQRCVPLKEAARLASEELGRRITYAQLYAWMRAGLAGEYLRVECYGQVWHTSVAAIRDFGVRVAEAKLRQRPEHRASYSERVRQANRRIDEILAEARKERA